MNCTFIIHSGKVFYMFGPMKLPVLPCLAYICDLWAWHLYWKQHALVVFCFTSITLFLHYVILSTLLTWEKDYHHSESLVMGGVYIIQMLHSPSAESWDSANSLILYEIIRNFSMPYLSLLTFFIPFGFSS